MNTFKVYFTNGEYYFTNANGTAAEFEAYLKQDGGLVTFEDSNGKEFQRRIDRVEQIIYRIAFRPLLSEKVHYFPAEYDTREDAEERAQSYNAYSATTNNPVLHWVEPGKSGAANDHLSKP